MDRASRPTSFLHLSSTGPVLHVDYENETSHSVAVQAMLTMTNDLSIKGIVRVLTSVEQHLSCSSTASPLPFSLAPLFLSQPGVFWHEFGELC